MKEPDAIYRARLLQAQSMRNHVTKIAIEVSEGADLDAIGKYLDVKRRAAEPPVIESDDKLRMRVIARIAGLAGQDLDKLAQAVDTARLMDGWRGNAKG